VWDLDWLQAPGLKQWADRFVNGIERWLSVCPNRYFYRLKKSRQEVVIVLTSPYLSLSTVGLSDCVI
jgi:hypothetical protein